MTSRTLTLGKGSYPVILPKTRDPRLHVAAVIITVHVLGQIGLRFQVSVPQILSAILTCAVIEVGLTFRAQKAFVWPGSAMLTGSGVALILRVPGTPPGDHWSTYRWYVFAGVAAFSLLTKYAIRYRGSPLFNPSNVGLVVAFLLLGTTRAEPLDFWWAPWARWMILAYAVILVGGLVITARMQLLATAVVFWACLAAGIGVLAASGHCMTARWAFAPVCGFDYWWAIVSSPEVLIFLFFMLTDPKTVPMGRVGRVVFAVLVAITSTLLMATQSEEFGTKVALLGGLVLVCAARPLVDRLVPEPRSTADDLLRFASRLAFPDGPGGRVVGGALRLASIAAVCLGLAGGIVAAGSPARGVVVPAAADVLNRVPHDVNPATLPEISVDQDVLDWNHEISGRGAQEIVLTLVENLELENQALRRADASILTAVDHGDRLDEMRGRLQAAASSGTTTIEHYRIDHVHVTLLVPFGRQDGLSLGLVSRGTDTRETYDASGHLRSRTSSPFATTFVVRRATGTRWLNVAQLPPGADR